jgi:phosphatidylserine/phosphatidylglycerophosphate/cardiolipin synthase-like enzyme
MIKLFTWTKNKKLRKRLITIMPLLLLFLAVYSIFLVINYYQEPVVDKISPVNEIKISEPFSGELFFNDNLGDEKLSALVVSSIDKAEKSVDLAMYSLDDLNIRNSLMAAANRGVLVTIVFSSKHEASERSFFAGHGNNLRLLFVGDEETGYMHHKFMLVDKGLSSQQLFFGSYNFTEIQDMFDPSFLMITSREELVTLFSEEFTRLLSKVLWLEKKSLNYNSFAAKIEYQDGFLELWFPPSNNNFNLKSRMTALIDQAKSNIKVMIWYLTDSDIASSLLFKAKNIPVSIITDDFNWSSAQSIFPVMQKQKERQGINNLTFITDEKRNSEILKFIPGSDLNSFLHHHTIIIDDELVLFGTNNWSSGGFFRNDESVMISNINSIVKAFNQSYLNNLKANE